MAAATVLMVAEKPSICNAIAAALSKGQRMDSHGRTPPVHEFESTFLGKKANFKVTSVTGHIFSVDFPSSYQSWDSVDPIDLFVAPIVSIPEGKGGIVKHLEREARDVDYLVLWLDCDREGENICFEVIRCVEKFMRKNSANRQTIYRAKFSAITPKDIEKAMTCLVSPNENESKAVEARQELDLKIGVAFSRFQTKYFQGKYGDLDSSVISYGPCQTPTLGFCVDRYDEIQTFSPESFWSVDVKIEAAMGPAIGVEWVRGRLFDQSAADMFLNIVAGDAHLVCSSVKESETRKTRPQPLNTVELLKIASSRLGIGPHAAMKAAEELYLSGYLSYPRTESTQYPSSFDIRDAVRTQTSNPEPDIQQYARALLNSGPNHPRAGKDMGDHPPITPVGVARDLSGDKARMYDLVVRHFLATVSDDALFLSTKVTLVGPNSGESFILKGKRELRPGFLAIAGRSDRRTREAEDYLDDLDGEDNEEDDYGSLLSLPEFRQGQSYKIASTKLRQGQTSAPGHLTEAELIGMMEKNGIGTDASIATHINNIVVRNYVTLGPGRTLVPTTLGVVLVHGYLRIDPALVLPDVRAAIESFCNLIAKGEADKLQVVEHSLNNFKAKFQYFCHNINKMDSLFEASFSPLAATGKYMSKCGKCLRYMRYIPLKPQRLYCQHCEETYSLPQNGTIKLYKELKCPLDSFELVLFSLGNAATAQGKSYPLCPYCYNHPPPFASRGEDMEDIMEVIATKSSSASAAAGSDGPKEAAAAIGAGADVGGEDDAEGDVDHGLANMGCDSCMHPSCKHGAVLNAMCECPGANAQTSKPCKGMLVLDVNSKPNWKLSCNRCNTILRFRGDIHSITPHARQQCEDCGLRIATFEFSKAKTPLPNGDTTLKGCIMCDDLLNSLTEIIVGRSMHLTVARQIRYKRGAGGRGRGRGRGRGGGRGRSYEKGSKNDPRMSFHGF